eukprot:2404056-Pyramimonas_sp.AAC.1
MYKSAEVDIPKDPKKKAEGCWIALGCISMLGFTLVYIVNVGLSFTLPLPTQLDSRCEDVLKAWTTLR